MIRAAGDRRRVRSRVRWLRSVLTAGQGRVEGLRCFPEPVRKARKRKQEAGGKWREGKEMEVNKNADQSNHFQSPLLYPARRPPHQELIECGFLSGRRTPAPPRA